MAKKFGSHVLDHAPQLKKEKRHVSNCLISMMHCLRDGEFQSRGRQAHGCDWLMSKLKCSEYQIPKIIDRSGLFKVDHEWKPVKTCSIGMRPTTLARKIVDSFDSGDQPSAVATNREAAMMSRLVVICIDAGQGDRLEVQEVVDYLNVRRDSQKEN